MPRKALRPCRRPGCIALVRDGRYCEEHKRRSDAEYDAERGTAAQRGYDARWRQLRRMFLARHPLCADPFGHHAQDNRLISATEVDHITPRKRGGIDGWDNLQALCKACHSRKTALEDGRWG